MEWILWNGRQHRLVAYEGAVDLNTYLYPAEGGWAFEIYGGSLIWLDSKELEDAKREALDLYIEHCEDEIRSTKELLQMAQELRRDGDGV